MLVPAEAIEAATKVFKDQAEVTVQWSANKIGFVSDGVKVAAKLLADQYPPWWENLLATRSDTRMVFSRRDFLAALDRAVLAADTEGVFSSVIAIPRDDGLELKAMGGAGGEAREGVEADIAPEFKPFGFNPNRIAALLGAMRSDRVTFEQVPIPNSTEFRYVVYADDEPEFAGCFAPVIINKALAA
jgi:DNA polymerase III sliding clamp (beta) subunit (PCNA family)